MTDTPHAMGTHAADADIRHEYARHVGTIAVLRLRLREIASACGGGEPVGFCEVCGAALFPVDRPAVAGADLVTCGREAPGGNPADPCYYRPNRPDGG